MSIPEDARLSTFDKSNLPEPNTTIEIPGLSSCTTSTDPKIHINTDEPVIIIVHGCKGSAARFRSLAEVFAFHGQQAYCFNYNDRRSLAKTARKLNEALAGLSAVMHNTQITVIGHSQGGLISRKALVNKKGFPALDDSVRLVTIAAPFAGISAADHCASIVARVLTLGLAVPLCKLISGDKWYEITHPSPFIQEPGELSAQVDSHLKIVTDESNSCRNFSDEGECIEDDFVFSLGEQYFDRVDNSAEVENVEVVAGHAEIVGDYFTPPRKLITLLQSKGFMAHTDPGRKEKLELLLTQLYQ